MERENVTIRGAGTSDLPAIAHLASADFTRIAAIAVQDSERFWESRGFGIGEPYT